jgi:hypothetical protein
VPPYTTIVLSKTGRHQCGADEHIRLLAQLDQEGFGSRAALLLLPPLPGVNLALDTPERLGGGG